MRHFLLILALISSLLCFSQQAQVSGDIADTTARLSYESVTIQLRKGGTIVASTLSVYDGTFQFQGIAPGSYWLVFMRSGDRGELRDSVIVSQGQHLQLQVKYPSACPYTYPEGYVPRCPFNHTEGIIPIRYGKPASETSQRAKQGKIRLGGCMVTGCDPQFYCPIHKQEF